MLIPPPPIPTGLALANMVAQVGSDGTVTGGIAASWNAVTDPQFDHYQVRISLDAGVHWLNQVAAITSASWTGLTVGATATVQVASVTRLGTYSAFSASQTLVVTGTASSPSAPTGLSVVGGIKNIFVQWTDPPNPDLAYTEVWIDLFGSTVATGGIAIGGNSFTSNTSLPASFVGSLIYDMSGSGAIPAGTTILSIVGTTVTISANVVSPGVAVSETLWMTQTSQPNSFIWATSRSRAVVISHEGFLSGGTLYVWVRSVNTSGLQSGFTGSAHDTLKQVGTIDIQANSVTSNLIAANTIVAGDIAANTITSTQIAAGTITGDRIAAGTITAATGNIGNLAVNTLQIANAAVTIPVFNKEIINLNWSGSPQGYTPVTITATVQANDSVTVMVQCVFELYQVANSAITAQIDASPDGTNYTTVDVITTPIVSSVGATITLTAQQTLINGTGSPISKTLWIRPAFTGTVANAGFVYSVSTLLTGTKR